MTQKRKNKIIPYHPKLKAYARELRKRSTLPEVLIWMKIKGKALGVEFHRQVPILDYIVDFYCHEIFLAIEIDGEYHQFKKQYDKQRSDQLEKVGVKILRFKNDEVLEEIENVIDTLKFYIKLRLNESI